jgi:hypothetical protein
MALTGHLSDLSLSELIEFFCNQRKSGRLKVLYPAGAGYFYLQSGSVVDARIGVLHGIDAVYYALTLPNAEFEFSVDAEPGNRTINQPWTQVVLEGLRRLDENISPGVAFPVGYVESGEGANGESATSANGGVDGFSGPEFLSFSHTSSKRKPLFVGAIVVAVLGSVAAIGVPAGWYHREKANASPTAEVSTPAPVQQTPTQPGEASSQPSLQTQTPVTEVEDPAAVARRQREKERRAREAAKSAETFPGGAVPEAAPKSTAKRVVVTVTYDESGRVTQASGGDANALRIARQKRFPPGKAGSATVTIPIN